MKTNEKKQKSTLDQLRDIRDRVSEDLSQMTYEERQDWLKKQKSLHPSFQKENKNEGK